MTDKNTEIYLDNAATTPVDSRIKKEIDACLRELYGNPGSTHALGVRSQKAVETARQKVADILHCSPAEIIFTSGGTESINLAIQGVCRALKNKGKHIITSLIEHPAVLETCKYLENHEGFHVTYLTVDKNGLVDLEHLKNSIRKDTILITIMYANNEVGTVQHISNISALAHSHNIYFHTDACQAAGLLDINVTNLGVDLMTLNSNKMYGPKGVGVLFAKKGVTMMPLIFGGGQENGLRSGTENVANIVGFAHALQLADADKEKEVVRIAHLRATFIDCIKKNIPSALFHGDLAHQLPNTISVSFPTIEAETLVLTLSDHGIYASTGSACTSKDLKPSHVLTALGISEDVAHSTLRFTLGKQTTHEDITQVIAVLPKLVQHLQTPSTTLEQEPIISI